MKNKLEKVAEEAVGIMKLSNGSTSASAAVKLASANKGLNDESISRICTMVNRKQHRLEKTSHGPGNLWKSRWSTAKPEEVLGKSSMNKSASVATGSVEKVASVKNKFANLEVRVLAKQSAAYDSSTDDFFKIPEREIDEEAVYQKVKTASIRDMREIIRTTEQAVRHGEGELLSLGLKKTATRSGLVSELMKFSKEAGLTLGEEGVVLTFLAKEAGAKDPLVVSLITEWDRSRGVDLDAVKGKKRDSNGDLEVEKIAAARQDFTVRPVLEAALTNYTAFSDLTSLHEKVSHLVNLESEESSVKIAVNRLTEDVKEMTALFSEEGFYE